MGTLLLRLAAPVQSYGGYRLIANSHGVHTYAMPTKSAVAGLLGACLGRRDITDLGNEFGLHVRIDRANPEESDLQVTVPLPEHLAPVIIRRETLRTAKNGRHAEFRKPTGGSLPTALINRGFLPYSEFIVAIDGEASQQWLEAARDPRFLTYLGRRPNAPTFPFVLGLATDDPVEVLRTIPRVHHKRDAARGSATTPAPIYRVTGDYGRHRHKEITADAQAPVATREEQLAWLSMHLH